MKTASKPLKVFGRNLARLRSSHGITQEALAERAEIHARYLQKLEGGAGHPSLVVLGRLKRALGCQWNELLDKVETL
ncbi:MAG: helix-turn-helix domain-containing protein [Acidobacteriota bacterium]|nr:helix-turn-helix domain-containing protein [Acidobacteriota bacterium]